MAKLHHNLNISTSGAIQTGAWIQMNLADQAQGSLTTFTGSLTSGDSIALQVSNVPASTDITAPVTVTTYTTTTFAGTIAGGYTWVRFVKTGTTGAARVDLNY